MVDCTRPWSYGAAALPPSDINSRIATKTTTNYFIQIAKEKKKDQVAKKEYKQTSDDGGGEYGYTYLCSMLKTNE